LLGRLSQITGGFFPISQIEGEKTTPFKENPKLNALIDDLCECSDFPVIIVAFHVAEIKAIHARLSKEYEGDRVEYICGEVGKDQRATIIEDFKHGDVKLLVANARTIGTGYNLQISHVQYFFSNSYSMEEREQVEDRIHRDGQKAESVLYKDIIARNTIDEKVLSVLKSKRDLLDYMRGKSITEFLGEA
jgi:superfamily II DNA helicase RecQ